MLLTYNLYTTMKILILGIDGYIGFPLAMRLINGRNEVFGVDNFYTRKRVKKVNSDSVIKINSMEKRIKLLNNKIKFFYGDVSNSKFVYDVIKKTMPDGIVHLGEQRSAPYSMISLKTANETLIKNIKSTMNIIYAVKDLKKDIHIVKLGSMGEYGTPNVDIPEGFFNVAYNNRADYLPFPRMGQSWYHLSKIDDTYSLMLSNKIWNLNISDVMQGVVYGTRTKEINENNIFTRFDIDEVYGTVLNRFAAQSIINMPLTVYGKGEQKRTFLSLEDSITCLDLILNNPPENEYKVYNQFDEYYSLNYIADKIKKSSEIFFNREIKIDHLNNPRIEMENHYYNPINNNLKKLGYKKSRKLEDEIPLILKDLNNNKNLILKYKNTIMPKTLWR